MSQPPNTRSSRLARGTKSFTSGDRPSVRLPRRIVPIWLTDPMGLAMPFLTARTPAMKVVATAPRPTHITPSFPVAGAISTGFFTERNYITGGLGHRASGMGQGERRAAEDVGRVLGG